MRAYIAIGLALIFGGALGLALEHVVFDGVQEILDAGSIKVLARTDRFFPATTLVSAFALAAGLALLAPGVGGRGGVAGGPPPPAPRPPPPLRWRRGVTKEG